MRAVALISGGLDSLLAAKLVLNQGTQVVGVNFFTGFAGDHDDVLKRGVNGNRSARKIADQLGIKLEVIDVVERFRSILLHPQYGYGAHLNPCLDCKLFMIAETYAWMKAREFDFIVTGEVLGQRPMSQRADTLPIASKLTHNLVVRPLSARLLEPTVPELNHWLDRSKLEAIRGRSRARQLELAKLFGFKDIPQPGGGCLLTEVGFCKRLKALIGRRCEGVYTREDLALLRVGRQLALAPHLTVTVGRDEVENRYIRERAGSRLTLQTVSVPGALLCVDGEASSGELELLARVAAYFSKGRELSSVTVALRRGGELLQTVTVEPLAATEFKKEWYL